MTRLAGRLPKGDSNGLSHLNADFIADPTRVRVAVVLVDCQKITTDVDDDSREPTLRIRRIEAITDKYDQAVLRRLLQREYERRTGRETLPFDLEETVIAAFGQVLDGLDTADLGDDSGDQNGQDS